MNKASKKRNKLFEVLTSEYKYENIFLLVVAVVALSFGAMILTGDLEVKDNFPVLGKFPVAFAWTLIAISSIGVLIVAVPFYIPSVPELRKISWGGRRALLADIARVFIFMLIVCLALLFFDLIISEALKVVYGE